MSAPLDFWSINNYAWALQGNELRSGQFGITKYQDQSGLPILITETGHSSTEDQFPGAPSRQRIGMTYERSIGSRLNRIKR